MAKRKKQLTVSETLRKAIEDNWESGVTSYRIAKNSSVDQGTIDRFVNGERANIRIDTVDRLCEGLGLVLRPKE